MSRAFVLIALLAALPAIGADAPTPSEGTAANWYFKIKDIPGPEADGSIPVTGFAWDSRADVGRFVEYTPAAQADDLAASRRDAAAGLPTGKRQHKPFTITKEIDKATPILMQACADGKHLDDVEIWYREGDQAYLRYTLKDAIITSYSISRAPDAAARPVESISFSYAEVKEGPADPAAAANLNSSKSN